MSLVVYRTSHGDLKGHDLIQLLWCADLIVSLSVVRRSVGRHFHIIILSSCVCFNGLSEENYFLIPDFIIH